MLNIILHLLIFLISIPSFAISEINYERTMREKVIPFVDANLKLSTFQSYDGLSINYGILKVPKSKGTVVIANGRTESYLDYREPMYDLAQLGYSSAIMDHRGQGQSARLVKGSDVGHVDKFSDYVRDFTDFVDKHLITEAGQPRFILGFSMGGAIAALYLAENPGRFQAVALISPMIKINLTVLQSLLVVPALKILSLFENPAHYAPSLGPYDEKADITLGNACTSSDARYDFHKTTLRAFPSTVVGGSSIQWTKESLSTADEIRRRSKNLKDPIVLIQGENDSLVQSKAQKKLCEQAANCRLYIARQSRHCAHAESDPIRDQVWKEFISFFEAHSK